MAEAYKRLFLYAAGYDSTVLNHVDDASSLLKLARLITDDKQLAPDTSNSSSIAATWQHNGRIGTKISISISLIYIIIVS